jgi:peptidoglycan/xylan/chitin deacetylase (PgdA/CDA1 family)
VKVTWRRLYRKLRRAITPNLVALKPLRAIEGLAALLVVTQAAIPGINSFNGQNPIVGLRLEGHTVGQLIGKDFRRQTHAIVNARENRSISITVASYTGSVTLRQLGEHPDEKQVNSTLLQVGRTGNLFERLIEQDRAAFGNRDVLLGHPQFNNQLTEAYLTSLDQKIDISPTNAYFALKNQKVVVHPDTAGTVIDVDAAIAGILRTDPAVGSVKLVLPTKQTRAIVTSSQLLPLLPQVRNIAQKPLAIVAGGSQVTLSREQLVALIVPKLVPDPKDSHKLIAQVSFDQAKLNAAVDSVVKQAAVSPQPTIVNNGRVIRQGKSGVQTEDDHPVVHVLSTLIQREAGISAPDAAQIPLVAVDPPVVQQVDPITRTGTGVVSLTFDDGPGAYTEQILDILKKYNVHATFYVIGRNVQRYPQTMQRIVREGHSIGNHSFTHTDLSRLSRVAVLKELTDTQVAIEQACGVTPTAFRPPYGAQNQTIRGVAASIGLSVNLWSVDPRDWAQPGSGVITQRVLSGDGKGSIILLHVLHQQTVDALPSIITGIRAQGYTLN